MGKIEKDQQKRTKRKNLEELLLRSISIAGVLSVGLVAPNVIMAMDKLGLIPNMRQKEYIASSASRLTKKGFVEYDGHGYSLTKKGTDRLLYWEASGFNIKKPTKWDKKWRVIIFDIPERKKKSRERIRWIFNRAGLVRLQDSVWVYPYDCEDVVTILKTELGIGKQVLYMLVDEIENDKRLRKAFNLLQT